MNLKSYLSIAPAVRTALRDRRPVVALESTSAVHMVPPAQRMGFLRAVLNSVSETGAVPAMTAVVDGMLKIGLDEHDLVRICDAQSKATLSSLPVLVAAHATAATTAAAAMVLASLAGIRVFSACAIGGVRGSAATDVSADLQQLRLLPVAAVCGGFKAVPDAGPSLEYLETAGVPVLGLDTEKLPAFLCGASAYQVEHNVHTVAEAAGAAKVKWDLGLTGGLLLVCPAPGCGLSAQQMDTLLQRGLEHARSRGIHGRALTPFLTAYVLAACPGAQDALQQTAALCAGSAGRLAVACAALQAL